MTLTLLTSIHSSLDSVSLCQNSMRNSPLLKPLHEYPCTLISKLPQFCCSGRHCFGKGLWYSPYLLQLITNSSFSCSLGWLCPIGLTPTKRQTQFLVNTTIGLRTLKKSLLVIYHLLRASISSHLIFLFELLIWFLSPSNFYLIM